MRKIALATCKKFSDLTHDDKLLAERLRLLGFEAQPLIWNENQQRLCDFAAVIIRSCWDYHFQPQAFLAWVAEIENTGVKLFNPPNILRWNHDKKYLSELSAKGARIPQTVWLKQNTSIDLLRVFEENHWEKAVVKPTVSATAWQTCTVSLDDVSVKQTQVEALLTTKNLMIQEFIPQIQTNGEWSFVFFNKQFSHAVLKHAKAGDFRVQNEFGGVAVPVPVPPLSLIAQARAIVEKVEGNLTYARVDGVEVNNDFCLMELELIEPALFLEESSNATQRFAEAIISNL